MEELRHDLSVAYYVSVYTDASNHNALKLFPTPVRYFDYKIGTQIKNLEFSKAVEGNNINITQVIAEMNALKIKYKERMEAIRNELTKLSDTTTLLNSGSDYKQIVYLIWKVGQII